MGGPAPPGFNDSRRPPECQVSSRDDARADGRVQVEHGVTVAHQHVAVLADHVVVVLLGVEVFQDENNGSLLYVTESGVMAVVPGKSAKVGDGKAKGPEFMHGMELAVRKAGERDFTKETKKVGVEVYKDENNGSVIYISDAGELTVVP